MIVQHKVGVLETKLRQLEGPSSEHIRGAEMSDGPKNK
jgi:hypothetical protein